MISLLVPPALLEPLARLLAGGELSGDELDTIDEYLDTIGGEK